MTTEELWTQFFYHLRIKRRSKATIRFYEVTQRTLVRYSQVSQANWPLDPQLVSVTHLRAFVMWLEDEGLAPGGIHAHVRALKAFFGWAHREELLPRNPAQRLERPTLPNHRLPAATPEYTQRLLLAAKQGDQPLRDVALLMMLFDTGIRLAEVIGLTVDDLLPDRGLLRVVGKGNKERMVPIGAKALTVVSVYLRRGRKPHHAGVKHLLLSRHGKPLTRSGVSIRLNHLAKRVGLQRELVAPHAFRRGFAVEFLRNGGDLFTLQQILGHTTLDMTRRYVAFLDEDLKAAHVRFSPGDRL